MNANVRIATRHLRAIAVNDSYLLAPDAEMLYAADDNWWWCHPESKFFSGLKVSVAVHRKSKPAYPSIHMLQYTGEEGFDPDPSKVRSGGNSGYQALHIAIHADAKRILLFGFDMHAKNGLHWFGNHPTPLRNTPAWDFERRAKRFGALAEAAQERGIEVINCCPGSAIEAFPIKTMEEVL